MKELGVAVVLPIVAGARGRGFVSEFRGLEGNGGGPKRALKAGPGLRVEAVVVFALLGYPVCLA